MVVNQEHKDEVKELVAHYQKELTEKLRKIDPNLVAELRFAIHRSRIEDLSGPIEEADSDLRWHSSSLSDDEFGRGFASDVPH